MISISKFAESVLWAGLVLLLIEPRAEAYVCLSAGSLIIQITLSGFLLGAASIRAMFLIRYRTCLTQIKGFSQTIRQKWGNARV